MNISEAYHVIERKIDEGKISEALGTGQFDTLLKSGVSTLALKGYREANFEWEPAVPEIVNSTKIYEEYPSISAPNDDGTGAMYVEEGEEFGEITFGKDTAQIRNRKMGYKIAIPWELAKYDQTREIERRAIAAGSLLKRWERSVVTTFYNDGDSTTCYDGQPSFDKSGGHPNITGGTASTDNINGATLGSVTESALESAMKQIYKWNGMSGEDIDVNPVALIYAPDQFANVMRIFKSPVQVGGTNATPNVWQNSMKTFMLRGLEANAWILITDHPGLVWQYVQRPSTDREVPNTGESFSRLVSRYRFWEASALGCFNWRFGFRGN